MGKWWRQWQTFFSGGSKITADGDCSHEIKGHILLGRKVMTNVNSMFESRDITFTNKGPSSQGYSFSRSHVWVWELDCKESWMLKNWCLFFLIFIFTLFYFTILYWFCHTLTWIHHGCTCDSKHEPPSHLPSHNIPLGHPHAPAPSMLYPASDIDWWFDPYMIIYMFQCHSPKSSQPLPLPLSPEVCYTHLCLFCCLAYRVIIAIFLNSIYMC